MTFSQAVSHAKNERIASILDMLYHQELLDDRDSKV
jgi:hypothetical protein